MKRNSRIIAISILLGVFCVGVFGGIAGNRFYLKKKYAERRAKTEQWKSLSQEERISLSVEKVLKRMDKEIDLSRKQRKLVNAELKKSYESFNVLQEELRKRFNEIFDEHAEAIEEHLKESQIEEYRAYLEERNRDRKLSTTKEPRF